MTDRNPNPDLLRLIRQLDQERTLRIKAERRVHGLEAGVKRLRALLAAYKRKLMETTKPAAALRETEKPQPEAGQMGDLSEAERILLDRAVAAAAAEVDEVSTDPVAQDELWQRLCWGMLAASLAEADESRGVR